jgi:hypothetical protein
MAADREADAVTGEIVVVESADPLAEGQAPAQPHQAHTEASVLESAASPPESAVSGPESGASVITIENLYGDDAQVASLVIRRCMALGVDPLNDKEVHIWRGKHGVNFQLAYTLMTQWVRNTKGGHTEPRYADLTPEEKQLRGLAPNDQATRVSLRRRRKLPS